MPERWRRRPGIELHWRDWGGDSVVFEQRSGHTYQFAPLAAAVMACFEEHDRSLDELTAQIALDLGSAPDNDIRAALEPIVSEFLSLGWIESTDA